MNESFGKPDRKLRMPETGGGSGAQESPERQRISVAEWKTQLKEKNRSDAAPKYNNKRERKEVEERVGEEAMAAVFRRYKARDEIAFEAAVKGYAQALARGASEAAALVKAANDLDDEKDVLEFRRVVSIVNDRLETIGILEPPKVMTEEELLAGLEGLGGPLPEPSSGEGQNKPAQTPDNAGETPEKPAEELDVDALFAKLKQLGSEPDEMTPPETPPPAAASEYTPVKAKEIMGRDKRGRPVRYIIDPEGNPKKPRHASGTADDDDRIFAESHQPVEEEQDIIDLNDDSEQKTKRVSEAIEGVNDRQEKRLDRLAQDFDRRAQLDGANPNIILGEMRAKLSPAEIERFLTKLEKLGWKMNGEVHQQNAEEPKPETKPEPKPESEYVELAGFKTDKDMEREFGQPAGKLEKIPFWILDDGDAAIILPSLGGARRIGEKGYFELNNRWYEFKEGSFSSISKEEARRRSMAIESRKMTAEELRQQQQRGQIPSAPKPSDQLSLEETAAPVPGSPDEYGAPEVPDYQIAEAVPGSPNLAQAHRDFNRIYTSPDKLASAYHEAVTGLTAAQRSDFDDDLEHVLPDVPIAILHAVIKEEQAKNPPPKEPKEREKRDNRGSARPQDRQQQRKGRYQRNRQ